MKVMDSISSSSSVDQADDAFALSSTSVPVSNQAPDPEADILSAIGAGDLRRAITLIMERYGVPVFRFCRDMVRDDAMAEDIHQQVFIEAYRDLGTFSGRSTVKTWVFGIARHRCLDAAKSKRRWLERFKNAAVDEPIDGRPEVGDRIDDGRLNAALSHCLDKLAPNVRTAVLLRFQQGFTFEAMAEVARDRPDTLRQRVARALPVLRRCIENRTGGAL